MATGAVAVHEEEIRTALLSAMAAVPASASARGRLA
jgi:hypothetical protein